LILAIHRLRTERKDIFLELCSAPKNNYEHILKLVEDLKLQDAVRILNYVTYDDLVSLYKSATALVMAMYYGQTNILPLEAFALGCSVASSDVYIV